MEPRSILVVDDETPVRDFVRMALERKGYRVGSAADGKKAREIMIRERFDAILTDLLMPECDGLELITQVRRRFPEIRIVAMSGGGKIAREQYLRLAQGIGAHVLLQKPFLPEQLFAAVESVFTAPGPAPGPNKA